MTYQQLALPLRRAIATHRVAKIRQLVDIHGLVAFSAALSSMPPRVAADALSLIPLGQRAAVRRHLSVRLREDLGGLDFVRGPEACAVRGQPVLEREHVHAVRRAS